MSPEAPFNCRRLPARLNAEEEAVLIGCCPQDIPILTRGGLIPPLGSLAANAVGYLSPVELEKNLADEKWGVRVTTCPFRC
jgi:hypothetical protein